MTLTESAANIKRYAVAGKPLAWCIDSGLIKEWGGRIARFNTAGWLPLQYAQALGVGGRNGVEILPNVVMQANHLGYTAGQVYYSLDAAVKSKLNRIRPIRKASGAAQVATPPAPTPVSNINTGGGVE